MIYSLRYRFGFVHIPRTGGMSITEALAKATWPDCRCDMGRDRHIGAEEMQRRIGGAWEDCFRFAVVRNPWAIVASDYQLACKSARELCWQSCLTMTDDWVTHARRVAEMSFEQFVRRFYFAPGCANVRLGGFWATYCQDRFGHELGVEPIRFCELSDRWPEIVARCGLPGEVELSHANAGDHDVPTPWTAELVKGVGLLCCDDIARFGFDPPPI